MDRKKRFLASAALTASLAAGGVLGAMFGTPTLSSAQTDPAPQEVEPAPSSAPGEGEGNVERAPAPAAEDSERRTHCFEEREGNPRHRGQHHIGLEAAAEALGMTPEELKAELRNGRSVAEVAESRNVELDKVVEAIVAAVTEHAEERANEFVNRKGPPNCDERRREAPPAAGTSA